MNFLVAHIVHIVKLSGLIRRKANQIHSWFVANVQDGEDDCNPHYVSKENFEELLEIVNKILNSTKLVDGDVINGWSGGAGKEMSPNIEKGQRLEDATIASEYLPTESGFFFGSTDYDQWYWEDLLTTKEILEDVLKNWDDNGEYYYEASW